jgi:hypothetical protein
MEFSAWSGLSVGGTCPLDLGRHVLVPFTSDDLGIISRLWETQLISTVELTQSPCSLFVSMGTRARS